MGRIDSIRRIEADMVEEEQIKEAQQLFVNSPEGYINHSIENWSCLSVFSIGTHISISIW